MLDVRALSLALSAFANLFELTRHLFDGLCERRQLAGDGRYVLSCRHLSRFYAEKADFQANAKGKGPAWPEWKSEAGEKARRFGRGG